MMAQFPIFLSIVLVARNQSALLEQAVRQTIAVVELLVSDYEVIVVDNGSDDASVGMLKGLTSEHGLPNMQVYALTKEVDRDAASWVGVENALGDYIAVVDITTDDIHFLPTMLNSAVSGADVVFAKNLVRSAQSLGYRLSFSAFNFLYSRFNGVNLQREAPMFRLLNKRVANFILQHPQPALTYRHLPATGGFAKVNLEYSHVRLVTTLSMFGALANLIYSGYIIEIAIFKENVAPGWVTMSLQNSGMFFLISLVLLVLGEYILHMANLSTEGPLYHVAQEFTSAVMTRKNKLNIETVDNSAGLAIASASPRVDPVEAIADGRHE
jgi:glycosyltransferase involved in cell wall biosynthesis